MPVKVGGSIRPLLSSQSTCVDIGKPAYSQCRLLVVGIKEENKRSSSTHKHFPGLMISLDLAHSNTSTVAKTQAYKLVLY